MGDNNTTDMTPIDKAQAEWKKIEIKYCQYINNANHYLGNKYSAHEDANAYALVRNYLSIHSGARLIDRQTIDSLLAFRTRTISKCVSDYNGAYEIAQIKASVIRILTWLELTEDDAYYMQDH